jgi:hypothetical protein
MPWLNSLDWMTLLDIFNTFKLFLPHHTDWSHVTIESFELNDVTQHVQSIQTISCTWHRLKPCNNWMIWIEWCCSTCSIHSNYFFHMMQIEVMLPLNSLNWMTLLDVFNTFKLFLPHRTDWSHVTIELFELNDIAQHVQSIQTISSTWHRLKPCNNSMVWDDLTITQSVLVCFGWSRAHFKAGR